MALVRADAQTWSREVDPVDYLLYRGESDPRSRSSMMSVEILDQVPDWQRLRQDLERASRVVVRLRQKIVAPIMPITRPQWIVDPDFDVDYHLRRVRVPEPGTLRQVLDLAYSLYAGPLDLSRPLWEATLVEGVDAEGGRAALLWKISHSVSDGVGGIELDRLIRSYERDPDRGPMPPLPVPEDVSPAAITRKAARTLPLTVSAEVATRLTGALGAAAGAARAPAAAVNGVARFAGSLRRIIGPPPVQPSPLLQRRSLNRRFDVLDIPLERIRGAAKQHGCSVNDAYIAAICGGLRRYHDAAGVYVEAVPLAMPVSLRSGDDPVGGNRWAGVRIAAPVGEPDPVQRMKLVRQFVITGRTEPAINALGSLAPVLARLPWELIAALGTNGARSDVQASNVPGHAQDTYIGGAKVLRNYPFGPLPLAAMMIVMLSHAGRCYVGVHYDTAAINDGALFMRCLGDGFDEVMGAGTRKRAKR
jgi:WS/DGAT/MGAT family acyltransferase